MQLNVCMHAFVCVHASVSKCTCTCMCSHVLRGQCNCDSLCMCSYVLRRQCNCDSLCMCSHVLRRQCICDRLRCRGSHHGNSSYCGFIKIDDYESPDGDSEQMSDIEGRTSVCHPTSGSTCDCQTDR